MAAFSCSTRCDSSGILWKYRPSVSVEKERHTKVHLIIFSTTVMLMALNLTSSSGVYSTRHMDVMLTSLNRRLRTILSSAMSVVICSSFKAVSVFCKSFQSSLTTLHFVLLPVNKSSHSSNTATWKDIKPGIQLFPAMVLQVTCCSYSHLWRVGLSTSLQWESYSKFFPLLFQSYFLYKTQTEKYHDYENIKVKFLALGTCTDLKLLWNLNRLSFISQTSILWMCPGYRNKLAVFKKKKKEFLC